MRPANAILGVLLSLTFAGIARTALAGERAALVLEKQGTTIPDFAAYSEIPGGTSITIPRGAEFVFLHYHTCDRVTVAGGSVQIGIESYGVSNGARESHIRIACPAKVEVAPGMQTATLLVRGLDAASFSAAQGSTFVILGNRRDNYLSARLSGAGQEVFSVPIDGSRFRWPADIAPPVIGRVYTLTLTPKEPGSAPITLRLEAVAASMAPADVLIYLN
jgi:hypothetical protein